MPERIKITAGSVTLEAELNDGPTALEWRLRAIDSATASIDFQTFLWHFDTVGAAVLDHVVRAADRGVRVRMLVDDTFLVHEDSVLLALAEHPNIEYRVFNPFKRRAGGFATRQLLNLAEFGRLDHRMHNKAMVVDNRVAIVGGRNIADEYFGLDESANFRDLELLLGGQNAPFRIGGPSQAEGGGEQRTEHKPLADHPVPHRSGARREAGRGGRGCAGLHRIGARVEIAEQEGGAVPVALAGADRQAISGLAHGLRAVHPPAGDGVHLGQFAGHGPGDPSHPDMDIVLLAL